KRQMEIYQWLLRERGFTVSDTGYFVYANASRDKKAFDGRLEFEVTLISYIGDTKWIEPTLREIKACLENGEIPAKSVDCDYCNYREAAGKALMHATAGPKPKTPATKKLAKVKYEETKTAQLF
ncbi:MAG: hypothetical protein U1C53_02170, partial [Candidatus Veblenbacteria bacterium]|nr:hypothetical protein [Candidatus Veblenbacteria bacterium]